VPASRALRIDPLTALSADYRLNTARVIRGGPGRNGHADPGIDIHNLANALLRKQQALPTCLPKWRIHQVGRAREITGPNQNSRPVVARLLSAHKALTC